MRWTRYGLIAILTLFALSRPGSSTTGGVPGTSGAPGHAASFQPGPCAYRLAPPLVAGKDVICGAVAVPLEHRRPTGPTISIPVVVIKHTGSGPVGDPIVYLLGGPGSKLGAVVGCGPLCQAFRPHHDYIQFEQRGVGQTQPALECPEIDATVRRVLPQTLPWAAEQSAQTEALLSCARRLQRQGVALGAYNTIESAADVDDIRVALGYRQLILFGTSDGSLWAQQIMRAFPRAVSSVFLDSVVPMQFDDNTVKAFTFSRATRLVFAGCAAQPSCDRAYPHLAATFARVVARLNAHPVAVPVVDPTSGARYMLPVTGDRFIGMIYLPLYLNQFTTVLPGLIASVDAGNPALLAAFAPYNLSAQVIAGYSNGLAAALTCNDGNRAALTPPQIAAGVRDALPQWTDFFATFAFSVAGPQSLCGRWPTTGATPLVRTPVVSRIPTLIFEGRHDPTTPPVFGQLVARSLDRSYYVEFPDSGHATLGQTGGCGVRILAQFVADPTRRPDESCVAALMDYTYLTPAQLAHFHPQAP